MLSRFKSALPSPVRTTLAQMRKARSYGRIFAKYKEYTMIDPQSYNTNLELASWMRSVPGSVVECGVWRGGMCAGMADILGPARSYHLFDSFEGLPPAQDIDGQAAKEWQQNTGSPGYYDNCKAEESYAAEAMKLSGATNVHLHKGWFEKTLPGTKIEPCIALLRLDADWYDSTMCCLENLYPQVVRGGLILIDDYYAWDGCARAVHDYLSRTSSVDRIRSMNNVCYIEKRSEATNPG